MSSNHEFITWLIQEIENRNWSQRELARHAGISNTTISKVLSGMIPPSWEFCAAISEAFDQSPLELFYLAGLLKKEDTKEGETIDLAATQAELIDLLSQLPPSEQLEILLYTRYRHHRLSNKP